MKIQLNLHSNSLHTAGIITGFYMLAQRGELSLGVNDVRDSEVMADAVTDAVVDGEKIVFDLNDGYSYDNREQIEEYFAGADVIFKRSFSEEGNCGFCKEIQEKIKPLGFNYFVTCRQNPLTLGKKGVGGLIKTLKLTNSYVSDFEASTLKMRKNPKVLFLTRLWDPEGADIRGNDILAEERHYINKTRTETIRILKSEFGSSFFGGAYTDEFSKKYCPELLVDKSISLKRAYLMRMKKSDICVNTMGLHGSIGWKTGEYIAAARAIVSEEFKYRVTGDFAEGKNYLSFKTPEMCAAAVARLMDCPDERVAMSAQNAKYYREYLRPDMQVKRALCTALGLKEDEEWK